MSQDSQDSKPMEIAYQLTGRMQGLGFMADGKPITLTPSSEENPNSILSTQLAELVKQAPFRRYLREGVIKIASRALRDVGYEEAPKANLTAHVQVNTDQLQVTLERMKAEVEILKAEAEKARSEATQARAQAEKAQAEAEIAKSEASRRGRKQRESQE